MFLYTCFVTVFSFINIDIIKVRGACKISTYHAVLISVSFPGKLYTILGIFYNIEAMMLEWLIALYWHTNTIQIMRSSQILINLL